MAKTDVWMPIFIGDYLSATTHLTTAQHGAYFLLLMAAWKFEGKLPNDDDQLAAITKLSPDEWQKTKRLLVGFFSVTDSFWIQERLLSEYLKSQRTREVKRASGALGGRPKKQNESEQKPNGLAKQKQNETPSPSPSHTKKENKFSFSPDDLTIAELIRDKIAPITKSAKSPNLESWADTIRLMREADKRTIPEIRAVFLWANQDDFWRANILSAPTLRKQFDKLFAKLNSVSTNGSANKNGVASGGSRSQNRPLSAVDRVRANAAAELAQRESAGPQFDNPPVDAYDRDVWPQVDQSIRGSDRPIERMGCIVEGAFARADKTRS